MHLACLWIAVVGSVFSAYFIIVANSWMQHPVGVEMVDGRPVMTDAWAVFTNNTAMVAVPHTIFGALAVAGGFLLGIAWYHLWRRRRDGIDTIGADGKVIPGEAPGIPGRDRADHAVWIRSLRIGAVVAMISFAGTAITGDLQGKLMFEQQPMKMAAAEAACHDGTGFSVLSIGNLGAQNCEDIVAVIEVPGILSFLAKGDFTTEVKGVNTLLPEYQAKYGTNLPDNPIYGERAGQENRLPSRHGGHLLGLPDDDRLRQPGRHGSVCRPLDHPQGHRSRIKMADAACRLRHPRPVRRQRRRLDLHRNGPPAIRRGTQPGPQRHRPGVYVHRRRRLTRGVRRGTAGIPDRPERRLRRPPGGGSEAAGEVHPRRGGLRDAGTGPHAVGRRRGRHPGTGGPGSKPDHDVLAFAY